MSEEPHWTVGSEPDLLLSHYLDFYREKAIEKVLSLSVEERETSRVPSVWTPLQLLHHLAYMEQRWFVWGFLAEQVEEPHGDEAGGVWGVPPGRGVEQIVAMLRATGERTRSVLASYPAGERRPPWAGGSTRTPRRCRGSACTCCRSTPGTSATSTSSSSSLAARRGSDAAQVSGASTVTPSDRTNARRAVQAERVDRRVGRPGRDGRPPGGRPSSPSVATRTSTAAWAARPRGGRRTRGGRR